MTPLRSHILLATLTSLFLLSILYSSNFHLLGLNIDARLLSAVVVVTAIHVVWLQYWEYRSLLIAYVGMAFAIGGGLTLSVFIEMIANIAYGSKVLKLSLALGIIGVVLILIRTLDAQGKRTPIFLSVFILANVWTIAEKANHQNLAHEKSIQYHNELQVEYSFQKSPNVYYLVPDSYVAFDSFPNNSQKETYQFLKSNGFTIYDNAFSNFPSSTHSMWSTFSMDIQNSFLNSGLDIHNNDMGGIMYRNGRNIVAKTFLENGYDYYIEDKKIDPINSHKSGYSDIDALNLFLTAARLDVMFNQIEKYLPSFKTDKKAESNHFYNAITASTDNKNPKFIYSHSNAPHYESRECFTQYGIDWTAVATYQKQIDCVNKDLQKTITFIKASDPTALIIIQADHGLTYNLSERVIPLNDKSHIHNAYSILLAVNWPVDCQYLASEKFTPVNLYRRVFACLSGTKPDYDKMASNISIKRTYSAVHKGQSFIVAQDGALKEPYELMQK